MAEDPKAPAAKKTTLLSVAGVQAKQGGRSSKPKPATVVGPAASTPKPTSYLNRVAGASRISKDAAAIIRPNKRTPSKKFGPNNVAIQDSATKGSTTSKSRRLPCLFDSDSGSDRDPTTPKKTTSSDSKVKKTTPAYGKLAKSLRSKDRSPINGGYKMMTDEAFDSTPLGKPR